MKKHHIAAVSLLSVMLMSSPAFAEEKADQNKELETLRKQISDLVKKVESLETKAKQQATQPAAAPVPAATAEAAKGDNLVLAKGSFPGSILIPGTDTSVKLNGYVKLDFITDAAGASGGLEYNKFSTIPLDRSARSEVGMETRFNARQSRVGLETRTPTDLGEMKTYIEGDFYGATAASRYLTNGDGFQIRHAYGTIGPVLAGQTWSLFMDPDSMNETMDYGGPAGLIFIRQGQVRYTHKSGNWTLAGSIENPQGDFFTTDTNANVQNEMPDFVARTDYKFKNGYLAMRGMFRQINAASYSGTNGTLTTSNVNKSDTKYGYGFGISGKHKIYDGASDSVNFQFVVGDGVGRYLYDLVLPNSGAGIGDVYLNKKLQTQVAYGGYAGYQHVWNPHWRSNVFGGFTKLNISDSLMDNADANQVINKLVATGHMNLVWQPVPCFKVGTEYMHAYRKHKSNEEGNLDRIQTSFTYSF